MSISHGSNAIATVPAVRRKSPPACFLPSLSPNTRYENATVTSTLKRWSTGHDTVVLPEAHGNNTARKRL